MMFRPPARNWKVTSSPGQPDHEIAQNSQNSPKIASNQGPELGKYLRTDLRD